MSTGQGRYGLKVSRDRMRRVEVTMKTCPIRSAVLSPVADTPQGTHEGKKGRRSGPEVDFGAGEYLHAPANSEDG